MEYKETCTAKPVETRFDKILHLLMEQNSVANEIITKIETKLNRILTFDEPSKNVCCEELKTADVFDELQANLNEQKINNIRLDSIARHLEKII